VCYPLRVACCFYSLTYSWMAVAAIEHVHSTTSLREVAKLVRYFEFTHATANEALQKRLYGILARAGKDAADFINVHRGLEGGAMAVRDAARRNHADMKTLVAVSGESRGTSDQQKKGVCVVTRRIAFRVGRRIAV
jgi:hypothetical protein